MLSITLRPFQCIAYRYTIQEEFFMSRKKRGLPMARKDRAGPLGSESLLAAGLKPRPSRPEDWATDALECGSLLAVHWSRTRVCEGYV